MLKSGFLVLLNHQLPSGLAAFAGPKLDDENRQALKVPEDGFTIMVTPTTTHTQHEPLTAFFTVGWPGRPVEIEPSTPQDQCPCGEAH